MERQHLLANIIGGVAVNRRVDASGQDSADVDVGVVVEHNFFADTGRQPADGELAGDVRRLVRRGYHSKDRRDIDKCARVLNLELFKRCLRTVDATQVVGVHNAPERFGGDVVEGAQGGNAGIVNPNVE